MGPLDNLLEFNQIFYVVALIDLAMIGCLFFFDLDKHKTRLKIMFAPGDNTAESDHA